MMRLLSALAGWLGGRRQSASPRASVPPATTAPAASAAPPTADFAARILTTMLRKGYRIDDGEGEINIVYVVGVDPDGKPNRNRPNAFDDARIVVAMRAGKPVILGAWEATIETGKHYTERPINGKGAARISFGQHRSAWRVGVHHAGKASAHEALVQAAPITVYRDRNKDYDRAGDPLDVGLFGINQHHGYDFPRDAVRSASAGCLVGRTRAGHAAFIALVKSDPRYRADRGFLFSATVIERID